jgi:hypothetical protein
MAQLFVPARNAIRAVDVFGRKMKQDLKNMSETGIEKSFNEFRLPQVSFNPVQQSRDC